MAGDSGDDEALIEIHDPEIDAVEVMRRIRESLEEKRRSGLIRERDFPRFGVATMPPPPVGAHDTDLYYHLQRANDTCADVGVAVTLADSPLTRLPVVGRFWALLRRQTHELIVYYLGLSARKQVGVNTHLVSVLNRLAAQNQAQAEELEELRRQVQALREQAAARQ